MCGFAGIVAPDGGNGDTLRAEVASMIAQIIHRGPDASGVWSDADAGVFFGHRRLSIVELSEQGAQPMQSASGRWCITYNGEIYNFGALKTELEAEGASFRGNSDTEVLLEAIEHWGVDETVRRANGMFAFALWDRMLRKLWFARDRMGKKPLYYTWLGRRLAFASELKSLMALPSFERRVHPSALDSMLRFNAVHGEQSIFRGVHRLSPGTLMCFSLADMVPGQAGVCLRFWSPSEEASEMMAARVHAPGSIEELERVLLDACKIRALADVPVGAFLSGGVDSSLVVALLQAQSARPVRTFSIGFSERKYNEAHYAKDVADYLGTDHTELYVTPQEARDVIPRLPEIYDEPFSDKSQLPTFLVCELARRDVTVALSGDGGDELFLGYGRYLFARKWWERLRRARPLAGPAGALRAGLAVLPELERGLGARISQLSTAAGLVCAPSFEHFYRFLISEFKDVPEVVRGLRTGPQHYGPQGSCLLAPGAALSERAAAEDTNGYLVEDILVKVDRASMSKSLEVRAPLLDYRVFQLAWRFAASERIVEGQGKQPLREVLWKYVPRNLVERPKMGFGVPVGEWLRGPLRAWADDLLSEQALAASNLLNTTAIQRKWSEHRTNRKNNAPELWAVLMFQAWWDRWMH